MLLYAFGRHLSKATHIALNVCMSSCIPWESNQLTRHTLLFELQKHCDHVLKQLKISGRFPENRHLGMAAVEGSLQLLTRRR